MLQERGFTQRVAYGVGDSKDFPDAVQVPGISKTGFSSDGGGKKEMLATLEAFNPDVIHVHNVKNIGVLHACAGYGKAVFTTHDFRLICPASMFYYKRTREVCQRTCGPGCFTTTLHKHCLTPRLNYATYFYKRAKWFINGGRDQVHLIAPSGGARERLEKSGCDPDKIDVLPLFLSTRTPC